jgi:enoyl-CoA hydratase/carnithine racemase
MASPTSFGDVTVAIDADKVATVEIHRPPDNFFDRDLIASLADAYATIDADPSARAIVLCAEGKHFCAGAALASERAGAATGEPGGPHLYDEAVRLFSAKTPVVAAVHGAAVGGGLGVAMSADFRVGAPESRFTANFARLGFHHGFGLTVTLPAVVGNQAALELLYTGRRIGGEEARRIGMVDRLVPLDEVRTEAHGLAAEIAISAPLAVASIRETMRGHLPDAIRAATDREKAEQDRLRVTGDFAEGVRAMGARRTPEFKGA